MKQNKNQKSRRKPDHRGCDLETASVFLFSDLVWNSVPADLDTADTVVVGRFVGKEALAAVGGSSSMIVNLIVGFFWVYVPVRLW